MTARGVSDLVLHNFPENGVKFLLHNPGNLHDAVRLLALRYKTLPDPRCFNFARRTIEPDTLIRADFSHGVTDLLVRLPVAIGGQPSEWIKIYLLFEHLSAHQRHIVPRSLGYAHDAYRLQERRWREKHESLRGLLYEVVIPIVIYTGERPWQAPTPFRELVQGGEAFQAFIPSVEPLFLSLPNQTAEELTERGGPFGTVLHVLQQRHAAFEELESLVHNAAGIVEGQLSHDSHRLRELLLYLEGLVYHFRKISERDRLIAALERSIRSHTIRKEVHDMGLTIADALREEGEVTGTLKTKQRDVIALLRRKFGRKVTAAVVTNIQRTKDLPTLEKWLLNTLEANSLEEVGIRVKK